MHVFPALGNSESVVHYNQIVELIGKEVSSSIRFGEKKTNVRLISVCSCTFSNLLCKMKTRLLEKAEGGGMKWINLSPRSMKINMF